MRKELRVKMYIAIVLLSYSSIFASTSAITYQLNASGRFGEHLTTYIKALKLAKDYGLPLIRKPIAYTENMVMCTVHELYDEQRAKRFSKTVPVLSEVTLEESRKREDNILYVVQWGTALKGCKSILDITDEELLLQIKKLIALPDGAPKTITRNPEALTIALHVRKGGGYDPNWVLKQQPLRFPADQYYLEQIKRITIMFPQHRIEIHLFTDDPEPKKLVAFYTSVLKNPMIKFVYREFGNKHNANVLEDFFAIAQCDCLIRPASCFSELAQMIGDHKVVIYPTSHKPLDKNKNTTIDKVMVVTRESNNKKMSVIYNM